MTNQAVARQVPARPMLPAGELSGQAWFTPGLSLPGARQAGTARV